MNAIIFPICSTDCDLIASGKKKIVVCKRIPKLQTPFIVYIYHTKTRNAGANWNDWADCWRLSNGEFVNAGGKIIGMFMCCGIMQPSSGLKIMAKESYMSEKELDNYFKGKTPYGLRISHFIAFDKPKELSEFRKACRYKKCQKDNCPRALVKIVDRINPLTGEQEFYALDGKPKWDIEFIGCANKLICPPRSFQYVQTL